MGTVFLKLLNLSITASFLIVIAVLFRLIFKKAPKSLRVVMWGLVALRLIIPVTVESPFGLAPETDVESAAIERITQDTASASASVPTTPAVPVEDAVREANTPVWEMADDRPEKAAVQTDLPEEAIASWRTVTDVVSVVWAVGAALMLTYAGVGYLRMRRRVRESVPMRDNIRICDHVETPFIMGILKPRIYMNSDISGEDARLVIAHEQAHIKRFDHVWKPLGYLLLSVYWFNPLSWLAFILLTHDIEFACDEKVLRNADESDVKRDYSIALVNCSSTGRPISPCPLGFAEVSVKERVKDVLNYKKPAVWLMTAAVVAIFVTAACLLTSPLEKASEVLYERRTDYDDFSYVDARVYEYDEEKTVFDAPVEERVSSSGSFRDLRQADYMLCDDILYARNFLIGEEFITDWTELGSVRPIDITRYNFDDCLPRGYELINNRMNYAVLSEYYDVELPDDLDARDENGLVRGNSANEIDRLALRYSFENGGCGQVKWRDDDGVMAFVYYGSQYICLGYQTRDGLPVIYNIRRKTDAFVPTVTAISYDFDGDGKNDELSFMREDRDGYSVYTLSGTVGGKAVTQSLYFDLGESLNFHLREYYNEDELVDYPVLVIDCSEKADEEHYLTQNDYYFLEYSDDRFAAAYTNSDGKYRKGELRVYGVSEEEKGDPGNVIRCYDPLNATYHSVKDVFYEDDDYEYCFSYQKSDRVVLTTADFKEHTLAEAVRDGVVTPDTMQSFTRYNDYWKIDKKTREYIRVDGQGKVIWTSSGSVVPESGNWIVKNMKENYNVYGFTVYDIDGDGTAEYVAVGYGPNKEADFPVTESTDFLFTVTIEQNGEREYFGIFDLGKKEGLAMRLYDDGKPYLYTYDRSVYAEAADRAETSRIEISIENGRIALTRGGQPVLYWDGLWGY